MEEGSELSRKLLPAVREFPAGFLNRASERKDEAKLVRKLLPAEREFPAGFPSRASERKDEAKLTKKVPPVAREFPPGCGIRTSDRKEEKVRKREVLGLSAIMNRSPEEKPKHPASRLTATAIHHSSLIASSSRVSPARERVLESIRLFRDYFKELSLQKEKMKRIDYKAWAILKKNGECAHGDKQQFMGKVPGVEIGDRFYFRIELVVVGLHRLTQGGIDYMRQRGDILATSIVASTDADNMNKAGELVYVGQGGLYKNDKFHEDQKLVSGNLALKNSIKAQNPVRVIRKVTASVRDTELTTSTREVYVYDGLYVVQECQEGRGDHGRVVFRFRLKRMPDQPPIDRYRG